ncbi:MAG: DUF3631 domain-containing protein [Candidatus Binataceae bacterium]|jgi:hypothetical protein
MEDTTREGVNPTTERTGLDKAMCEAETVYEDFSPNMRKAYRTVLVTFATHTHCVDMEGKLVSDATPIPAILSDKPNSGKTTVLELTRLMSRRGYKVSARNTTAPGMLRAIQEEKASLFLDQFERMISHTGQGFANRLDIIETGYERTGQSLDANGFHSTFCAKALTSLQSMFLGNPNLEAVRSRSIPIFVEPMPSGMMNDDDWYDPAFHAAMVKSIGERLDNEVRVALEDIMVARPSMEGISSRMRQIWRPLFRIAHVAGGEWPERVKAACREIALGLETSKKVLSPQEQLIEDIGMVVGLTEGDLTIGQIVDRVFEEGLLSGKYWSSEGQGSRAVGRAMRELDVDQWRIWKDGTNRPGFKRADLEKSPSLARFIASPDLAEQDEAADVA